MQSYSCLVLYGKFRTGLMFWTEKFVKHVFVAMTVVLKEILEEVFLELQNLSSTSTDNFWVGTVFFELN